MALDIIIPVYNEAENILPVLESLRIVKTPMRVLICYDHDDDNTIPVIKSKRFPFPVVLVLNEGAGPCEAVIAGIKHSHAEAVVVFPADDVHNAKVLDRMYGEFRQGADVVCGSRFSRGGYMKGCPWLKSLIVRVVAFTLHHFAGLPTKDPTNGFKLFLRRLLRRIPIESKKGFAFALELVVKAHLEGYKIVDVPAVWEERKSGKSRFRLFGWASEYFKWYLLAWQKRKRAFIPTASGWGILPK